MEHQTLYRRWRPRTFKEIVGQEHITRTLKNALRMNRLSHAYLFCGPRGTGKTTTAKILAKVLNCQSPVEEEPCNCCSACTAINEGRDIDVLEIDAASNRGIDEIRDLREKIRYVPAEGHYKVYIVDEVHMLTPEAFNALLKTLEEPPQRVVFILATTEPHKLPPTIISRCQRFDFHLLTPDQMVGRMKAIVEGEEWEAEEEALHLLARQAEGGMRDCLGLLEQCRAYGQGKVTQKDVLDFLGLASPQAIHRLVESVISQDIAGGLRVVQEIVSEGKDPRQFIKELNYYLGRLLILEAGEEEEQVYRQVPGFTEHLRSQRGSIGVDVLLEMVDSLNSLAGELRFSYQPQFLLELGFFKLAKIFRRHGSSTGDKTLWRRLESLEAEVAFLKENISREGAEADQEGNEIESTRAKAPAAGKGPVSGEVKPDDEKEEKRGGKGAKLEKEKGEVLVEHVLHVWSEILENIKKQRVQTYAWLEPAKPLSFEGNQLVLGFKPEFSLHMENTARPENRQIVERAISCSLGREIEVRCTLSSGFSSNSKSSAAVSPGDEEEKEERLQEMAKQEEDGGDKNTDLLLEGAVKLFNGRVLEVED